ncbi:unnamed protein product, partial [Lymnaea stagnalis]
YTVTDEVYTWIASAYKIYMWVFVAVGLPVNILTVVTISKFQSGGPASFLLCYLAIIDSVALVVKLIELNVFARGLHLGRFGCKVVHLPSATLTAIAHWTVVFICAERYVSVCKPLRRSGWITNKRCKVAVSSMSAVSSMFYTSL